MVATPQPVPVHPDRLEPTCRPPASIQVFLIFAGAEDAPGRPPIAPPVDVRAVPGQFAPVRLERPESSPPFPESIRLVLTFPGAGNAATRPPISPPADFTTAMRCVERDVYDAA